jgi:hypothetical protein
MLPVAVRILHAEPGGEVGSLVRVLSEARRDIADRHADMFRGLGIADVMVVVTKGVDDTPFGARLRAVLPASGGLVALGSGAVPLAREADLRAFVEIASSSARSALANNRFSADVVAVSDLRPLHELPDLPSDNALPRWLEEVCGFEVRDLTRRWRLQIDADSPLDLLLIGGRSAPGLTRADISRAASVRAAVASTARDSRAELLVAGRTSIATLTWLQRTVPARVRALVEERGLRASSELAQAGGREQRPAQSILGRLLDADGAAALGAIVADLADAAVIDTRVLLAHRLGADERGWPAAEDRFASDLLLPERISDRWLRTLTDAAVDAPVPVLLGGHTLVGPGLRLALRIGTGAPS